MSYCLNFQRKVEMMNNKIYNTTGLLLSWLGRSWYLVVVHQLLRRAARGR
jgi:hypothetical protein